MNRVFYLTLLLIIHSSIIYAQKVIFEPVFIDQCNGKKADSIFWLLQDSYNTYYPLNIKDTVVELPSSGIYSIIYNNIDNEGPAIFVEIKKPGIFRDTFYLKRVDLCRYVSNPPFSEFMDNCDSLANGKITDYYAKGKIRLIGVFDKGQLSDTLKRFYYTGELYEVYVPSKKNRKQIGYFKNGQKMVYYDYVKEFDKEYYESGKLKMYNNWGKQRYTEYFENGNIKVKRNHKRQIKYSENGKINEKMKRKEILFFQRIFSKSKYVERKYYGYKWITYDSIHNMKRKILFTEYGFSSSPFPDSLRQIADYIFNEISFYKNGELTDIINHSYVLENDKRVNIIIHTQKQNRVWIEIGRYPIEKIYEQIESLSKQ
jgi:antitoxin component YwqK of YwqJK toxin-antitoxin module